MNAWMSLGPPSALAGCLLLYLSSPRQRWLDRPLSRGPASLIAVALLAFAVARMADAMRFEAALLSVCAMAMPSLIVLACLGALFPRNTER